MGLYTRSCDLCGFDPPGLKPSFEVGCGEALAVELRASGFRILPWGRPPLLCTNPEGPTVGAALHQVVRAFELATEVDKLMLSGVETTSLYIYIYTYVYIYICIQNWMGL